MPPRELYARRSEHGWAILARSRHGVGEHAWASLESLEATWCLASPFAHRAEDADALAIDLARDWQSCVPRDILFLSGLAVGSPLFLGLVRALTPRYGLTTDAVPVTRRFRASLRDGEAGFLSRRSPSLRHRLRQSEKKALRAGVTFAPLAATTARDAHALLERLIALESRSWKGLAGDGLLLPSLQAFYREMLPALAEAHTLRVQVGTKDGVDVALIVGAVTRTPSGPTYRGLQFSFDNAYRSLSLGNLAQLVQVRALIDEGVTLYDLGSDVDYKRRWGEDAFDTVTLVAVPLALRIRLPDVSMAGVSVPGLSMTDANS